MRWKTTLVLLLATVGIGAYVSLVELRQPTKEERTQEAQRLLTIKEEEVTGLAVTTKDAEARMRRAADGWTLEPDGWRADPTVVHDILDRLPYLSAERTLEPTKDHPLDTAAFGLEPPEAKLDVQSPQPVTLRFGHTTPVGHRRYIQIEGRPEIFVVSTTLYEIIARPADVFRDPFFAPVQEAGLESIATRSHSTAFKIGKQGQSWRLVEPLEDEADAPAVQELVRSLSQLPVQQYIGNLPEGQDLKSLGLEDAETQLTLAETNKPPLVLSFGRFLTTDSTLRYAKRSDDPKLYAVKGMDVEALFPKSDAIRSRACLPVAMESVTSVVVQLPEISWSMERKDGHWVNENGEPVAAEVAESEIRGLADLRFNAIVADGATAELPRYGLDKADKDASRVILRAADGKEYELKFGGGVEGEDERYGLIKPRNLLGTLPESAIQGLSAKPATGTPAAPQKSDADSQAPDHEER